MDEKSKLLLIQIREEMKIQTEIIIDNINKTISDKIDEKLLPIIQENETLKSEITNLNSKVKGLELEARKNNVIIYGVEEKEKDSKELMEMVMSTLNNAYKNLNLVEWDKWEINNLNRVGRKIEGKPRPIKITLTLGWRKTELLKNKKKIAEHIYISEDFPKEVLEKRKELIPKLNEARKAGKFAILKYDQLIVKPAKEKTYEKRKRVPSSPPQTPPSNFSKGKDPTQLETLQPSKLTKVNPFDKMRHNRKQREEETPTKN